MQRSERATVGPLAQRIQEATKTAAMEHKNIQSMPANVRESLARLHPEAIRQIAALPPEGRQHIENIYHEDAETRTKAIMGLFYEFDPYDRKIQKMATHILKDKLQGGEEHSGVRTTAATILGYFANPKFKPSHEKILPVLGHALGDANAGTRALAAWALGHSQNPQAMKYIEKALEDVNPDVKAEAVRAIGSIQHRYYKRPVNLLNRALGKTEELPVREYAAYALGLLGHEKAPEKARRAVIAPLRRALNDADPRVREQAVRSLSYTGHKDAVKPLKAAARETDSNVRKLARSGLRAFMSRTQPIG